MILRVGTRGSKLAMLQTEMVIQKLKSVNSKLEFKIKIIKTTGDVNRQKPLFAIESKGIFEKEIDQAIMKGDIDFAVHSLKDVPVYEQQCSAEDLELAAIPKRDPPNEALVSTRNLAFAELPKGAVIGTSSLRRMAQIKFMRPDLEVKPTRGNIDTRAQKVKRGEFHGIIVAQAGLERMGFGNLISEVFPLEVFTPAAGQGALAVVAKKDRSDLSEILKAVDDFHTRAEVTAERSLIASLKGGCHFPIGAIAQVKDNRLSLYGCIFSLDSLKKISAFAQGSINEAQALGGRVAQSLLSQGAEDFAAEWRQKYGLQ
ncbi:MAG: hydroxymethylbilane synthase [Candidatus Bathyarchaeales archaeon]